MNHLRNFIKICYCLVSYNNSLYFWVNNKNYINLASKTSKYLYYYSINERKDFGLILNNNKDYVFSVIKELKKTYSIKRFIKLL